MQRLCLKERAPLEKKKAAPIFLRKCEICWDDDKKPEDMKTLSCGHSMCNECYRNSCRVKIDDAETLLTCPMPGCKTAITQSEIDFLSPPSRGKHERFVLRKVSKELGYITCPVCDVYFVDCDDNPAYERTWKSVKCRLPSCGARFCGRCGQAPHRDDKSNARTCEEVAALKRRADQESAAAAGIDLYLATTKVQTCPKCKEIGELDADVCKYAACSRCRARFCFLCGVELGERHHYAHYMGAPGLTGPFGVTCKGKEAVLNEVLTREEAAMADSEAAKAHKEAREAREAVREVERVKIQAKLEMAEKDLLDLEKQVAGLLAVHVGDDRKDVEAVDRALKVVLAVIVQSRLANAGQGLPPGEEVVLEAQNVLLKALEKVNA